MCPNITVLDHGIPDETDYIIELENAINHMTFSFNDWFALYFCFSINDIGLCKDIFNTIKKVRENYEKRQIK